MTHPLARARAEGYAAEPGDRNPYSGQDGLAVLMWRRGYDAMLAERIETGPAMRRFTSGE
ncbi:MAG: hypothetical protein K0U84_18345 [Actinomycetia bacterium]|nr:hypothetical protein [Actinomycetes bacterium]